MPIVLNLCCECGTTGGGTNTANKLVTVAVAGQTYTTQISPGGSAQFTGCTKTVTGDSAYWNNVPTDTTVAGTYCAECINGTITSIESRPVDPNTGQGTGTWTNTGEV